MTDLFDGLPAIFRDTFGEAVTYMKVGDAHLEIQAVVLTPALLVQGLAEIDVVTADTEIHCAVADLPAGYGEGDTVVVRGASYRVKAPMPDGHGMVRLPLFKA
jgi:hypothetical protein